MDVKEFLNKYFETIRYAEQDDGYQIAFPFRLYNDDHISSVFIREEPSGLFTITDNGNVFKYFENFGVDERQYEEKIKKICEMFNLTIENGIVKGVLGEYITNQTFTQLQNFLTGISHLATLGRLN